jgi:hypothetical protein
LGIGRPGKSLSFVATFFGGRIATQAFGASP